MNQPAPLAPSRDAISEWLQELPCRIGEILITHTDGGKFVLCHREDVGGSDLLTETNPEAASEIARHDDAGHYRPLKTAPNLRHGWRLLVDEAAAVRLALELFYPGRLAAYEAWSRDKLVTTPFRETLARQTGIYRAAARITEDDADALVGRFCRSDGGCLRTILWKRDAGGTTPSTLLPPPKFDPHYDQTGRAEQAMPLLCQETCNLVVAAAREVVKASQ